jgi:membrane fusion protein, multidrug efflux system
LPTSARSDAAASAGNLPAIGTAVDAADKLAHSQFRAIRQVNGASKSLRQAIRFWEGTPLPAHNTPFGWTLVVAMLGVFAYVGDATAQGASPPPSVLVTPAITHQVTETTAFVGRVTAVDKVDIVARVPGFIEERYFTEGQHVKKGDLLFRIEQQTYKAAVEQQRANLAKARATEVNAALQLERGRELVRDKNIPQATVDQRAADEAAAQADVMQAQATLDQAEINLGYTEIVSPIDGRIGLANFTVGNLVDPSSGNSH